MGFGSWNINVIKNGMPEKVATAVAKLNEDHLGAVYTPIAYLGSSLVNGTNHAVLMEQKIIAGVDTKNVVVVIFNEQPGYIDLTLVSIDRIVESGDPMGGVVVDVKDVEGDAKAVWDGAFDGFVGSKVEPFALLGTQIVNGCNYIYAVEMETVTAEPQKSLVVVTINDKQKTVGFAEMLKTKHEASLGYSFTW